MTVTTAEVVSLIQADREQAHDTALEALQATGTWLTLPLPVRRQLCASHALLGAWLT